MAEMSSKVAAKAFWVGEVEMELRRLTKEDLDSMLTKIWKYA